MDEVQFRKLVRKFKAAVKACPALKPRAKLVADTMLDHLDREAAGQTGELVTWERIGVEALARKTSSCTRDIERARAALCEAGIIELARRPAKDRPAQYRFRLAWLTEQSAAEPAVAPASPAGGAPDTGVADSGVRRAAERPTESGATPDKIAAQRLTPESSRSRKDLGINLGRAGTRTHTHARAGTLAGMLAPHFTALEISRWFEGCSLELDGSTAVLWAPHSHQREWIATHFADRLRAALMLFELEVRLGVPAIPPVPVRPELHAIAGGRA